MAAGSPLPTLTEEGNLSQASDTSGRSSLNAHVLRGLVGEKNILIYQPTSVWKMTIAVLATLCTGHTRRGYCEQAARGDLHHTDEVTSTGARRDVEGSYSASVCALWSSLGKCLDEARAFCGRRSHRNAGEIDVKAIV